MAASPHREGSADADSATSIARAIQDISEQAQLLVREEIELAKAEMNAKARSLAKGAAVGAAAGIFVLAALVLILNGLAWLTWWALPLSSETYFWGFFIVAVVLLLLAVIAGLLARRAFRQATPPKPELAIDEAKRIRDTVREPAPETRF